VATKALSASTPMSHRRRRSSPAEWPAFDGAAAAGAAALAGVTPEEVILEARKAWSPRTSTAHRQ